ncbi:uncharacterized protein LOC130957063 [Arachis stenosperma]|uniref:uncharacterized protein LOC130957063 n=1 Tax=Arachis stenosperma TaxID=217475 RepID=UPI0025AC2E06|nr:uncharacterized protein LOC130957063 [Arachis stenosperma]
MSPFRLVYGRACHLSVEVEHKAYSVVKECNFRLGRAGIERKLLLQELECLRLEAYENSRLYKEKVKAVHDNNIKRREFRVGDLVELYGVFYLSYPSSPNFFKVNGHRLKQYHGEKLERNKELEIFLLKDPAQEED